MISPRALLAGLAASMVRDEAGAARTASRAEACAPVARRDPAPAARVLNDPVVEEDQALAETS